MDSTLPRPDRSGCPGPASCDIARQTLALDVAELRERLASVEADADAYRAVAVEAIHGLHHVTRERDRLRRRLADLDERRAA